MMLIDLRVKYDEIFRLYWDTRSFVSVEYHIFSEGITRRVKL